MSDPPFVGVIARIAARRHRVPYVAIEQDVFPEIALQLGRLRNPVLVGALGVLVNYGLARAAKIVAIGETMRRRLVEKEIDPQRIDVIPNWIDVAELSPQPKDNAWARAHDLADKFVVMHSGNVGYAQNLDALIRAAAFLRDLDRLQIVVIGSGARKLELVGLAERLEVDSVVFMDYQERDVLPQSLSTGDLHFVGLGPGLAGYVVPSRMNGVLAVGRPVIVGADRDSEIVRVVEENACGVTIPAGRPELLAAAIRGAYDGLYDLDEMGRRGREYVRAEIDRPIAIGRYRHLIADLLE
jgi:colanic acid biosynthesis glycosyl transferase WcaI